MNILFNNNFWKNKKIFIPGQTGFKGSWLCLLLNLLGAEITGYSLKPKTKKNLYEMANIKKLKIVQVNTDENILVVKGAVPGKPGNLLSIVPSK